MFLTIITRCYKRPRMLGKCIASLERQTCQDWQHITIVDEIGIGIPETFRRMAKRDWSDVQGEYVYFLDDDNLLADVESVRWLRDITQGGTDMLIFRAEIGDKILPDRAHWGWPPVFRHIDLGCAIVQRDVFFQAAKSFGARYEGDYDYLSAAYKLAKTHDWLNRCVMRAQQVSHGAPE